MRLIRNPSIPNGLKRDAKYLDFKASMGALKQALQHSLLHLVYPTKCLHCHALLPPEPLVLCSVCASLLDLASLHNRCPVCFNFLEEGEIPCEECCHTPPLYLRMAAAFDYEGPAVSLVRRLKYAHQPYLTQGMAAFLVAQFDRLQWPMPDALVPVPLSFTHWLERGYNQSALLAEEMGRLLQRPVWDALKRRSGDFSQAALTLEQRKLLDGKRFRRKSTYPLQGKVLLVIDDVMTSGLTLRRCAEILNEGNPAALYALTFCRTFRGFS
jgi:ComF family protein